MFGPHNHVRPILGCFPDLCVIFVSVNSRNFVVKNSVGVTYIFCSRLNSPPTLATLSGTVSGSA